MIRIHPLQLGIAATLLWQPLALPALAQLPDPASQWNGYARQNFTLAGHPCFVTEPKVAAPGRPWVWRTSFPDFHAEVDLELLRHGWHVGFIDCVDMLGCDAALDLMDRFYAEVTGSRKLAAKPALEGVSRGGLHAYRYAARHPERIACLYADTPVMDFKSWPRKSPGAAKEWAQAQQFYGFKTEREALAFTGNPVDLMPQIAAAKIPLRHVISLSDTVVPPEENTLEARRRLRKLGGDMDVVTVAQGTPESNGHHFPLPEAFLSARFIMRHTSVLPAGHEYFQLRAGLANCQGKFTREQAGRVAFLGGSITAMSGWREEVIRDLQQRFPATQFDFISAGIGSLGSVPHAFRLERDVLARGPVDLLFVEAAVNDTTNVADPKLMLRGMEGVVRHARMANPLMDIVQLHFVMPEHMSDYGKGREPASIAQHERVAVAYGCASLNLAREVMERIAAKQFTWADDFKDLHPAPYGQNLYANSITRLLDAAFAVKPAAAVAHVLPPAPLDPRSYFNGRLVAPTQAKPSGGGKVVTDWTPTIPCGTREGYVHVPALVASAPGDGFTFEFDGLAAGLMIGAGPDAGIIEVTVDGGPMQRIDTFTQWSQSLYLPWAVMFPFDLKPGHHEVSVRLASEHHPKSVGTGLYVFNLLEN